jgi:hypothetical protein
MDPSRSEDTNDSLRGKADIVEVGVGCGRAASFMPLCKRLMKTSWMQRIVRS